jgi:hypothetical protein
MRSGSSELSSEGDSWLTIETPRPGAVAMCADRVGDQQQECHKGG